MRAGEGRGGVLKKLQIHVLQPDRTQPTGLGAIARIDQTITH